MPWSTHTTEYSAPTGSGAVGYGLASGVAQDLPDRGGGDAVTEPTHLAVDTSVSPCGILGVEALHELSELGRGWWPSGSGLWGLGPVARHQASVPADHGRRFYDQHHPLEVSPVKGPGQQGENGSVGGSEARPINLSLQNKDLMAQRQDLGVTLVTAHHQQSHTCDQEPEQVRYDRGHTRSRYRPRTL